jgi:hypothetical protein
VQLPDQLCFGSCCAIDQTLSRPHHIVLIREATRYCVFQNMNIILQVPLHVLLQIMMARLIQPNLRIMAQDPVNPCCTRLLIFEESIIRHVTRFLIKSVYPAISHITFFGCNLVLT